MVVRLSVIDREKQLVASVSHIWLMRLPDKLDMGRALHLVYIVHLPMNSRSSSQVVWKCQVRLICSNLIWRKLLSSLSLSHNYASVGPPELFSFTLTSLLILPSQVYADGKGNWQTISVMRFDTITCYDQRVKLGIGCFSLLKRCVQYQSRILC